LNNRRPHCRHALFEKANVAVQYFSRMLHATECRSHATQCRLLG
jgi:hypothetical protein